MGTDKTLRKGGTFSGVLPKQAVFDEEHPSFVHLGTTGCPKQLPSEIAKVQRGTPLLVTARRLAMSELGGPQLSDTKSLFS